MKKVIVGMLSLLVSLAAVADEGMWLLPLLQKLNIKDMQAKGLELTARHTQSVNGSLLKDAIVILGS